MNFISRIIKSINAMRERLKIERHEAMYGPHFNEECALKAVSKMENEDGSRGEHWSLEETTSIANQYGINLKGEKYNKYDWYVALNMIRSDYYRAVVTMTSSDHIKYFVELAKAWLNDKDIEEGKMWYYYYVIQSIKNRRSRARIRSSRDIVADIRKMIEDTKKMFMGGFPKPPMPPMPNVPAPMK